MSTTKNMTLLFILLLSLIAVGLIQFKCQKAGIIIAAITLAIFLLIGSGLLPYFLLRHLESFNAPSTQINWAKRNAIIVLGGGTVKLPKSTIIIPTAMCYSRIYEAAVLYLACEKSGRECFVIVSGGDAFKTGISEAVVYKNALSKLGVKDKNIIIEPRSMNTYQNAKFTAAILKENHFDQIILVTSGIHLKRALLYFSNFNVHPYPVFSDYVKAHISWVPLSYNFVVTDYALHEYVGIVRLHVNNLLSDFTHFEKGGR